ncbi:hypothetical protein [Cellulomonas phragmiteti]|uniref:DUF805 domain-containing protein n=1 Tax=Cellulomonas phragmiteti TaxID=478780 RepID=A0ABQ4DIT8_9CELL|nr:hypothetical protein [Cellulomonas phragmiteti]GIG38841.1 hypothetical protein Cph01nite_06030 [Cellulomonas phragmiteti]
MLPSSYPSPGSGPGVGEAIGVTVGVLLYIAFIAFAVYMYMRVARKAGWTLWHGLLILVPLANIVFLILFVFTEWPVERRLREAEARLAQLSGTPYGDGASGYGTTGYGASGYGAYGYPTEGYGAPGYPAPSGAQPPAPPVPPAPASPYDPPAPPAPPSTDAPPPR